MRRNPVPVVNTKFVPKGRVKECASARYVGAGLYVCECLKACPAFAGKDEKESN